MTRVLTYDGPAWLVTRYDDVRSVLADTRFSSDMRRPGYPCLAPGQREAVAAMRPTLAGTDPPDHSRARRAVIGEFTAHRVRAMADDVQAIVDRVLDEMLAAGPPADLVTAVALPVPSAVICALIGVPYADHDWFQERTAATFRRDSDGAERARAFTDLAGYLDELVTAKEAAPPEDDVLGRQVLAGRADGTHDHDDLVSLAGLLLVAGHETTANVLAVTVAAILRDPTLRADLVADPSRTPAAVEEFLRFFTIAQQAMLRVATEDVVVGETLVRAGEGVLASVQTANRDPRLLTAPDEMCPERGSRRHLAFGHGPHQCLGQHLARVELTSVIDTLLRRCPDLRLVRPVEELRCKDAVNVAGLDELPVTW